MATLSIRDVINKVSSGVLRIPKFQRGFVWDSDSVAFLMDSIYKEYPFGTIQLWRTRTPLNTERKFGPFKLFDREADYPIDYVLDGQQRITSIFGTFQSEIELPSETDNPFAIYFDFRAAIDQQDSQFFSLKLDEVDPNRHFPLNCLFDTVKYRQATENLENDEVSVIDSLQEKFKEAKIPYQILETDDRSKVAIVFERINRKGIPLDTFQLLTAWTWSDAFDLQEKFEDLSTELQPFGFSQLGENADLLLRICSAILTKDVTPSALIELNGNDVRDNFPVILNGIRGTIDFLKSEFRIENLNNLPYENLFIVLSTFFSIEDGTQLRMSNEQRIKIIKWFWKSLFTRRYSAGTRKNTNRDITEILKLRNGEDSKLESLIFDIQPSFFLDNNFSMRSVNTKSYILLLVQLEPRSFVSGTRVSLRDVLQNYNKKEFHHIVPKAYVNQLSNVRNDVNCLSNFCIISKSDNNWLGGVKPSEYKTRMASNIDDVLASAVCDDSLFEDNFDEFVENRTLQLMEIANRLMNEAST
ncbi:MAG: DUF262 domain-containing protein [Bacteroidota bacterium]